MRVLLACGHVMGALVAGLEGCEAEANVHYDAMLHSIHAFLSDFPECFACAQPLE